MNNASVSLTPAAIVPIPSKLVGNARHLEHVEGILQQFLNEVATATRNYGSRLDLCERTALVAAEKAIRAIAAYGDAGSDAIDRIKEVVSDNLLLERDLNAEVTKWLNEAGVSPPKLNRPSAPTTTSDRKPAAVGNGPLPRKNDDVPREHAPASAAPAPPKRKRAAKTEITAADAVVGIRLTVPFEYKEEEGGPRDWWERLILSHPELTHAGKVIGCFWARSFDDETGICFPSIRTIARSTGTGTDTVVKTRKQYQVLGLLGFVPGQKGRGRSGQYWPCFPPKPPACKSFSPVNNSQENDPHVSPFEKAQNKLGRRENDLKSAKNDPHAGREQEQEHKARKARRAKKGAPACAPSRTNGYTTVEAAVEEAQQVIQEIVAAAACTIEIFAAQPYDQQSNLKRHWRQDPAKARLSPEFQALLAAAATTHH